MGYLVVDNAFNRHWCPELIGKTFARPPSTCAVKVIGREDTSTEKVGKFVGFLGLIGLPAFVTFAWYMSSRKR